MFACILQGWGLRALVRIERGEMIVQYVGEVIRQAVAEQRERVYNREV
jgi:SET domain-containing protein